MLKKHVNRDSHIASSRVLQIFSLRKYVAWFRLDSDFLTELREYMELLKFNVTIKKKNSNLSKI